MTSNLRKNIKKITMIQKVRNKVEGLDPTTNLTLPRPIRPLDALHDTPLQNSIGEMCKS